MAVSIIIFQILRTQLGLSTQCCFFQANMLTEAGHSSESAVSEYTTNSLPADENTPLVREDNSTSRQVRCCEHFNCRYFLLIGLSLLSFAEVILLIKGGINFSHEFSHRANESDCFLECSRNWELFFFPWNHCKIPIIRRFLNNSQRSVFSAKFLDPAFIFSILFDRCLTQYLQVT